MAAPGDQDAEWLAKPGQNAVVRDIRSPQLLEQASFFLYHDLAKMPESTSRASRSSGLGRVLRANG
jgi:hypothetical protein